MSASLPATVLVLEENAAVQDLIEQALREVGHRTLTTNNSLEALELVRRVRIDTLVIGDLLAEQRQVVVDELQSSQPGLRVVSISGKSEELERSRPGAGLRSPFSLEDLQAAVTTTLDERQG